MDFIKVIAIIQILIGTTLLCYRCHTTRIIPEVRNVEAVASDIEYIAVIDEENHKKIEGSPSYFGKN